MNKINIIKYSISPDNIVIVHKDTNENLNLLWLHRDNFYLDKLSKELLNSNFNLDIDKFSKETKVSKLAFINYLKIFFKNKKIKENISINDNKINFSKKGKIVRFIDYTYLEKYVIDSIESNTFEHLCNFIYKIEFISLLNKHQKENLYEFMYKSDLSLTLEGNIIGYKVLQKISSNLYTDCHSGTIPQKEKTIVKIDKVDDRSELNCSFGLHVASLEYLKNNFTRLKENNYNMFYVLVKPENIVSIPNYDTSKIRVKEYLLCEKIKTIKELDKTISSNFMIKSYDFIVNNLMFYCNEAKHGEKSQLKKLNSKIKSKSLSKDKILITVKTKEYINEIESKKVRNNISSFKSIKKESYKKIINSYYNSYYNNNFKLTVEDSIKAYEIIKKLKAGPSYYKIDPINWKGFIKYVKYTVKNNTN